MSSQKKGSAITPARNNYSAPHTPIASAKRPRASLDKSMLSPGGAAPGSKTSLPPSTPLIHEDQELVADNDNDAVLSPMHKPKPLVVKSTDVEGEEQDIFSPMLHLSHDHEGGEHPTKTESENHDSSQGHEDDETSDPPPHPHHVDDDDEGGDEDDVLVEDDGSSQGSIDEDEFNPYVFIKSLPPYNVVAPLRPPIALPEKDKDAPPISLVLDLDETLVHCSVEPVDDADLVFPVVFHGMTYQVNVRLRPHLFTFLERVKGKFEVVIFTASQQVYADELLNLIDPGTFSCRCAAFLVSTTVYPHSSNQSPMTIYRRKVYSTPHVPRILSRSGRELSEGFECLGTRLDPVRLGGQQSARLWISSR
jgi:NLI interacting factor-like phosphatase